jgi:hypothetical protein
MFSFLFLLDGFFDLERKAFKLASRVFLGTICKGFELEFYAFFVVQSLLWII